MKTTYAQKLPTGWGNIAKVFAALGDPTRQRILLFFERDERLGIKEIAEQFKVSRTTIVHHLAVLEAAKLLVRQRRGRDVLFHVNTIVLADALGRALTYVQREV